MSESSQKRVLALKYRPKRFEDLVGQSTISQTLSLALDGDRLSHAYLFSGLRGSGKTSTARIMAKALICDEGPTSKPCEVCENCKSANTNRHLDIIEMDAASNRGIDDIKDLIEHTKYKPSSARFKVFIIDEVHMLTTQAFNALLKTLEEPPGFVKFILATTDPLKLPATILSRTQHFRFKKIATKDVINHLSHILNIENIDFDVEALEVLTRSGQGSLRDTLTLLDQAIIFSKDKITLSSVTDMLGMVDPKVLDDLFDTIMHRKDFTRFLEVFEEYEASAVCDELIMYLKQKMVERDAKFSVVHFDRFFRILSDAKYLLSINSDSGFVMILTLSKMLEATNLKTIEEIIEEVEKIEVTQVQPTVIAKKQSVIQTQEEPKSIDEHQEVIEESVKEEKKVDISPKLEEQTIQTDKEIDNKEKTQVEKIIESEGVIQENISSNSNTSSNIEVITEPVISLNSIDAIESINLDEEKLQEINLDADMNENNEILKTNDTTIKVSTQTSEDNTYTQESKEIEESISVSEPQIDKMATIYKTLTKNIYERDYDLGECFEKNFIYEKFEDNKLFIKSFANGDDKKLLWKYFSFIRNEIENVYGSNTEIDFIKPNNAEVTQKKNELELESKKSEQNSNSNNTMPVEQNIAQDIPQPKEHISQNNPFDDNQANNNSSAPDDTGSNVGAGCVADMINSNADKNDGRSKELNVHDMLNSEMINRAKELFDVKKIVVNSRT